MRRSDVARGYNRPLRIEPEAGKIGEPFPEPIAMSKSAPDVFQEEERRSRSNNGATDERPEVALVLGAAAFSGDGEGRTRKAGDDDLHVASPRASVQACEVVPDRSRIQGRFFHPSHEDGRREGVPLDVANGANPAGQAEVEPSDAGAERERSQSGT